MCDFTYTCILNNNAFYDNIKTLLSNPKNGAKNIAKPICGVMKSIFI